MLDTLISGGELMGGLLAVLGLLMVHPRTRRLCFAVVRFGKAHMSPWMLAVFGACLLIPGPLDEMVVLPILVAITLRTKAKRRVFARYMNVAFNH